MPYHHNLDEYLTAYLDGAGLRDDPKGSLFRTIGRGTRRRDVVDLCNALRLRGGREAETPRQASRRMRSISPTAAP